jgi:hypothetical protein
MAKDEKKTPAPEAPAAPADAAPGATKLSYPAKPKKGSFEHHLLEQWVVEQGRAMCSEKENGCWYPLNPKLNDENGHMKQFVTREDGRKYIVAECSWDPRHGGGTQFIPVKLPGKVEDYLGAEEA